MKLDLLVKTDTKRVKIGKSKITAVDKSADSEKLICVNATSF